MPAVQARWRMFVPLLAVLIMVLVIVLAGCSGIQQDEKQPSVEKATADTAPVELTVMAAASLKDSMQRLAPGFERETGAKLLFSFASSGDLQTQIEHGAPADVFISAGEKQMDALQEKGFLLEESRTGLLGNSLVIIAHSDSSLSLTGIEGLADVKEVARIAMCDPQTSPAGKYTEEALDAAGIRSKVRSKLIMAKDVRQVLNYVETGNVDIGFVYRSDAATAQSAKVIVSVPSRYHSPIVYPAAVLKDSQHRDLADEFIGYLTSEESSKVFNEYGFEALGERNR